MCSININAQTKKTVRNTTTKAKAKPTPKNSREYQVAEDGFEWYKVCKNGKYGAEDKNGNIIIPNEYDRVEYISYSEALYLRFGGGFCVRFNKKVGYYNQNGKCIIPFTRGYNEIYKYGDSHYPEIGMFYECKKDNNIILCDALGKEVLNIDNQYKNIKPIFVKGTFYYEVSKEGTDGKTYYGIMNTDGKIIAEPKYGFISERNGNLTTFYKDERITLTSLSSIGTNNNPFSNNSFDTSNTSNPKTSSFKNNPNSTNNSGSSSTTIRVEHHHDPVPMTEWVPCGACGHNPGVCQTCVGMGETASGRRCISCRGTGKCHFCNGQGGRYQTVYR